MGEYELVYNGARLETQNHSAFISKDLVSTTNEPTQVVAKEKITDHDQVLFETGDTIEIYAENTYYEVEYRKEGGRPFYLYPRAQINPQMGGLLASPDIKRHLDKDLYTHISAVPDPGEEPEWDDSQEYKIKIGEEFATEDVSMKLVKVQRVLELPGLELEPTDVAIKATVSMSIGTRQAEIHPMYIIKDKLVGRPPEISMEYGIKLAFWNVLPEEDSFVFTVSTTQRDYIILKAIEKPLINVLWIGTLILVIGFIIAINRRYLEFRKMREKGLD